MKKQLIAAGVTASVAIAGLTGLGLASAATQNSGSDTHPMSSLVSAIATKFNLKIADVQAVFDEQRSQMEVKRTEEVKTELAQLVKDGKLTQTQADAITTKRAELQKQREANRASMGNKTDTDRHAVMESERTALDNWFSDNNISTDYRYLVLGDGHGHRGPGAPGQTMSSSESSSSTSNVTSNN
ncbi:hypothetical protein JNM87_04940 [Candidatus Saccharibacteria bacterium]|nr:hypothetical protein [Candidatus Saccharibacteria bacterium]